MAVSTKNRRKVMIGERLFVWCVVEDDDSTDFILHVVSEDAKFIVHYHLGQPEQKRFLIVVGKEFPGLPSAGNCWIRVLCPEWEIDSVITPACVHRLVNWCLHEGRKLIEVNYKSQPITRE